ncbi:hypothetical protein VTL71DRAFT_9371 [Oculimacula yallundae]|uniref:Uncharacterized protein n=1 Tax=Oculimacula yallundae TaxID=86028 RepID=A0ABR4BSV9_9HELO
MDRDTSSSGRISFDIRSDAVCIVTGSTMTNNRQASIGNMTEWDRRSNLGIANPVWARLALLPPLAIEALETAGSDVAQRSLLPTHILKILVNISDFVPTARGNANGTDEHLRAYIQAVLNTYMALPVAPVTPLTGWQRRGTSIAFDLAGAGTLGYGAERAAENVLAAIQGWFNDPGPGALRRANITTVFLSIPTTPSQDPPTIESPWFRAWYRYVRSLEEYEVATRHRPWVEQMELQTLDMQNNDPGEIASLPGLTNCLTQGVGVIVGAEE